MVKTRQIIRGRTRKNVEEKLNRMKARGWYPVSDIKLDETQYDNQGYVCVVEIEGEPPKSKNVWGQRFHLR